MKALHLRMQGFGPYVQPAELSFTELAGRTLVLIHGPTGAGKTTILDAICYALFGVTSGAERSGEQMRNKLTSDSERTEVTYDFTLGPRSYRVRRSPEQQRKKQRGEGTTTVNAAAELWERTIVTETDDGVSLASGPKKVTEKIEELFGFDAAQFRQVVMLPQGEFRRFLVANSQDKEKLLETLFSTQLYADVTKKLKERARETQQQWEQLDQQRELLLTAAGVEGEEALREQLEARQAQFERELQAEGDAKVSLDAANQALEAGKAALAKLAELQRAQKACADAEVAFEQAQVSMASAKAALEREDALAPVRAQLDEEALGLKALEGAVAALAQHERNVTAVDASLRKAAEAAAAAEQAVEQAKRKHLDRTQARDLARGEGAKVTELRAEAERLQRVLESARALDRAKTHERSARAERDGARARVARAESERAAAEAQWRAMSEALLRGQAAALAATLTQGEPCPVCGSHDHPQLAAPSADAPTKTVVDDAREAWDAAAVKAAGAGAKLAAAETVLAMRIDERASLERAVAADGVPSIDELERAGEQCARALVAAGQACLRADALDAEVQAVERAVQAAAEKAAHAQQAQHDARAERTAAAAKCEEAGTRVPEALRIPGALAAKLHDVQLQRAKLEAQYVAARRSLESANGAVMAAAATLESRRGAFTQAAEEHRELVARLTASQVDSVTAPDLAVLQAAVSATQANYKTAIEARTQLQSEIAGAQKTLTDCEKLMQGARALELEHRVRSNVASAAEGDNTSKLSLQRYVLASLFDDVLSQASIRLGRMTSGRYQLARSDSVADRRSAAGLDLVVHDAYTGGARPVATLSGGESFMAALALSLGLSDVVQGYAGGVRLDTLFIDEGFGSLDSEALDKSLEVLAALHEGDRLVALISHVTELRERIDTRLEVVRREGGSHIVMHL